MSLPNKNGMTNLIRGCCSSIGLNFPDDPNNAKLLGFPIKTFLEQLDQSGGRKWNAVREAFVGIVQIRGMKWRPSNAIPNDNGFYIEDFDDKWFDDDGNKNGSIDTMVDYLTKKATEI